MLDDPPAEKNGSVIPITGSTETHIPMLNIVCVAIIAKKPIHMNLPIISTALNAAYRERIITVNNRPSRKIAPKKPNSSHATVKMKSL